MLKTIDAFVEENGITKSQLCQRVGISTQCLNVRRNLGWLITSFDGKEVVWMNAAGKRVIEDYNLDSVKA